MCHLNYKKITRWFVGCEMTPTALKSLSQNYFIFVLCFNYPDILLLGLFFFLPDVFHRAVKWMS